MVELLLQVWKYGDFCGTFFEFWGILEGCGRDLGELGQFGGGILASLGEEFGGNFVKI